VSLVWIHTRPLLRSAGSNPLADSSKFSLGEMLATELKSSPARTSGLKYIKLISSRSSVADRPLIALPSHGQQVEGKWGNGKMEREWGQGMGGMEPDQAWGKPTPKHVCSTGCWLLVFQQCKQTQQIFKSTRDLSRKTYTKTCHTISHRLGLAVPSSLFLQI